MTFTEFKEANGSGKPFRVTGDLAERWNGRIIGQGMLSNGGRQGGSLYLGRYGKGIGVPKLVGLALTCEAHVFDCCEPAFEMAQFFWEVAYEMATGTAPLPSERASFPKADGGPVTVAKAAPAVLPLAPVAVHLDCFPSHLQPGKLATMQPVDATFDRDTYIHDGRWWGQPKRDGQRMVIFATRDAVYYQARSLALKPTPDARMDRTLRLVADALRGPFILDGELWWPDVNNGEHRTSAQAAEANAQLGQPTAAVTPVYAVFEALYEGRRDLTRMGFCDRAGYGRSIVADLTYQCPTLFEFLEPATSWFTKAQLAECQHAAGREGEVWRYETAPYVGGKAAPGRNGDGETIVRTKYRQERRVRVTGLTLTGATKVERAFAAIQVADTVTGKSLGKVGTGFTVEDQQIIVEAWEAAQASGKPLLIEISSQGLTEFGQVWHPVFVKIVE